MVQQISHQLFELHAHCYTQDVGVVGWATGGGHGLATGEYGMGADNIIEALIVTPTSEVLTANACQNEDIFWAIRGGGGGTFGVILSVTVKAYPMPSTTLMGFDISAKKSTSTKTWWELVAQIHGQLARLQDSGLHGYYTMSGPPLAFTGALLLYNEANGAAEKLIAPLRNMLSAANATARSQITREWVPSWYDLVKTMPAIENVGTERSIRSSRLIPRRAVEKDVEILAETLEKIGPQQAPLTVSLSLSSFHC